MPTHTTLVNISCVIKDTCAVALCPKNGAGCVTGTGKECGERRVPRGVGRYL